MTKQKSYLRKDYYSNYGPKPKFSKILAKFIDEFSIYEIHFYKNMIHYIDHLNCFNHYIEVPDYDLDRINLLNLLTWWKLASNSSNAISLSGRKYLDLMSRSFVANSEYIYSENNSICKLKIVKP